MSRVRARGRLFRKYVVIIVVLVSGVLLTSGAIEIYFSYQENKTGLIGIQREKAIGAASKIEAFIKEIEHQLGWTTQPQLVTSGAALEQRRFDFLRLLRQVPAITEVSYLDAAGKEQLRVSRLAMDVVGSQIDFSGDPKFRQARAGRAYYGPVYFRKESEPYMTIAMAGSGPSAGVTVVEVNLKFIWDVVSQIKVGKAGHAYAVDGSGNLLAHPDISLVLQKTAFSGLPQVQAAIGGAPRPGAQGDELAIARDFKDRRVLTSYATIPSLRWSVFVEQPLEEAFQTLRSSIQRTALLLLLGVVLSFLASLVLARRMVRPIAALQAGAAKIGEGDLGERIDVRTGDELEALADQFNSMAGKLRESYTGLERKVEERTSELSDALEQQTATSEILGVISSSPTDVQPVFETIVASCKRLLNARSASVLRLVGRELQLAAFTPTTPEADEELRRFFPRPIEDSAAVGIVAREHAPFVVTDTETDERLPPASRAVARARGYRSMLIVPMLRKGETIGTISVSRETAGSFSDKDIALLQTFADQAVIAIENVRLFTELQQRTRDLGQSLEEMRGLSEVSQTVSSTLDIHRVLDAVAAHAVKLSGSEACGIFELDVQRQSYDVVASHNLSREYLQAVVATAIDPRRGLVRQAIDTGQPVQVPDLSTAANVHFQRITIEAGYHSMLAVPMGGESAVRGIVLFRRAIGSFDERVVTLLTTLANQSKVAIDNARLFQEIEEKSQQLEIANRHKSEFLANMSHELRTPLNAIIGFSEVLLERMFGEVNDKQEEYLQDIFTSGKHLLSLINDILDLSKVEAGRMELELTTFSLPMAIDNALTLVRTRAENHGITLEVDVDERLGDFVGDERKIKQVLVNLLSNAVKFTPEGGRVGVQAGPANGTVEISVSDTGIGIAQQDQTLIFEEFRQAGPDHAGKREGTGLGLTLTRKFVELHGGSIGVKSEVGRGSTFTFTLPVRAWPTSSS
jgi:signal transduction histidine kinase